MNKLFRFVARVFYTFLDVSGILLGIFLIVLGWYMKDGGKEPPLWIGWTVLVLGVCAFLIHISHFIISKRKSSEYFYTTRRDR